MVFSSLVFIFLFLPAFLSVYYLAPKSFRNVIILIGGYFFYAWGAPNFASVLLLSVVIDYILSLIIYRLNKNKNHKKAKWLLVLSLLMNLGLLGYFKYSNFFIEQVNGLLLVFGGQQIPWTNVLLPIGISFTVFQELSYIIEVYRGSIKPARSVIDFAAYLLLFPHVIAGPIVRYVDIETQLIKREYSIDKFYYGIKRFTFGLAKKVFIANAAGAIADAIFEIHKVNGLNISYAWLGIISYAIQIYFDFSGYSDMAIGLASMLGFHFLENFNLPYISQNITEFWRRWHISLSTWMREYLYIPLGGNRVSKSRMYLNLMIVFLLSGLWHGANWNFVIWGGFHGLFLVLDKLFLLKLTDKWPKMLKVFLTFIIVCLAWVFFRVENVYSALLFIVKLFDFGSFFHVVNIVLGDVMTVRNSVMLLIGIIVSFIPAFGFYDSFKKKLLQIFTENRRLYFEAPVVICLFIVAVFALTNSQFNPFIYFRF